MGTPPEGPLTDTYEYMDTVQDDDEDAEESEEEETEEEIEDVYDGETGDKYVGDENVEDDVGTPSRKSDQSSTNEREGPSQSRSTEASTSIDDLHRSETGITPINALKLENGSHLPSPDELPQKVESLNLSDIKTRVTSDLSKTHSYQQRKYHSKRSTRQVGRPQGSKAKQDKKVRLDHSGIWQ